MRQFRTAQPTRSYTGKPLSHYKDYREILSNDFFHKCAYSDCSEVWWGDGMHVDHFAPKSPKISDPDKFKKFADREHEYTNLIYACPQINRAKSNDWASDDPDVPIMGDCGYLNPCTENFNDYFERTDFGQIIPKNNPIAIYMWKKLKLYLKRYEFYWCLDQLSERIHKLVQLEKKFSKDSKISQEIKNEVFELAAMHDEYMNYLTDNYYKIIR